MKIALLGGGGFVGAPTAEALLRLNVDVTVLNRTGRSENPDVRAVKVDRTDTRAVIGVLDRLGSDALIDMIAFEEEDTLPLLAVLNERGGRLIFLSSCDVYAAFGRLLGTETGSTDKSPITETSPLRTTLYPYKIIGKRSDKYDKIPLEMAARACDNLDTRILRLPMMFGRGDRNRRFQSVSDAIRSTGRITLPRVDAEWRPPLLYIDDAATGIAAASLLTSSTDLSLHLGADKHPTWAEHAAGFADAVNRDLEITIHEDNQKSLQNIVLDSSKTRDILDWKPNITMPEAYKNTWNAEQGYLSPDQHRA
jgi:nucleoside-diphosphate-sugar epimerase